MTQYRVSRQGQEVGSFTLQEIVTKVKAREIELFDYIFDDSANDWVLMMEYGPLAQMLKSTKPPKPPTPETNVQSESKEPVKLRVLPRSEHDVTDWFILKGEHRFGPFEYSDLIQMLQKKIVYPFDFVWHSGLENWVRVAEVQEFQAETIRGLSEIKSKHSIFLPRQFSREKMQTKVLVHDNLSLWKGESFEISQGGIGVRLDNHLIIPGQMVTLHIKAAGQLPAFNAICEVVSKKFEPDKTKPIEYGFKFVSLSSEVQDELRKRVS